MAATANVFWSASSDPLAPSFRRSDPAMLLSPAMFSANGSLLFSPEVDDDDDNRNTLKFAKAAHVLSPIQSVLSSRGEGKGASERSTKVLSKEDLIRQGKRQTMRVTVAGLRNAWRLSSDAMTDTA
ncbi:hypothetical protein BGY98DRAFT_1100003 [Russula aff. rugulosa BPL654]|nr:hypothetical protein BGY98DRAFT_1100003 [Russula aff. rugulosa BPL654]